MRRAKRGMGIKDVPTKLDRKVFREGHAGVRRKLRDYKFSALGRRFLEDREKLREKLLAVGGAEVSPQFYAPIRIVVSLGYFQDLPVRMAPKKWIHRGECHLNAAGMWETWLRGGKQGGSLAIGTGYSLSGDGMWRPHSWIVDEDHGFIIETCNERVAYFGAVLSFTKSKEFAESELGPV